MKPPHDVVFNHIWPDASQWEQLQTHKGVLAVCDATLHIARYNEPDHRAPLELCPIWTLAGNSVDSQLKRSDQIWFGKGIWVESDSPAVRKQPQNLRKTKSEFVSYPFAVPDWQTTAQRYVNANQLILNCTKGLQKTPVGNNRLLPDRLTDGCILVDRHIYKYTIILTDSAYCHVLGYLFIRLPF